MHRNLGIGSWIARRARVAPARIALVAGAQRRTYQDLDLRITRLARGLRERGVGPGDRVAFVGPNHPAALETLFACGLLGATAVPVHPGFDGGARARVLAAAAPALVIDDPRSAEKLIANGSDEPIDLPIGLDHVALLAFSSGTTGPSKGVALTHGNLLFNAVNMLSAFDLRRDDVLLASAPLYRMGGLGFALTVLFQGGTCVLPDRSDPDHHLRLVEEHRVTVLFDTVGAVEALAAEPAFATAELSSLRVCATGGSYVPPSLVAAFRRRELRLDPAYGLTEAAPLALVSGRPPMLGAARVVDEDLEDTAPGSIGELLVAGPNVTPARALVDGWLRTGDAARIDADGAITVVGRMEDALVLDGAFVHPGPIEDALRERGGVRDVALVQGAPGSAPSLFVVAADRAVDVDGLAALCRAHLGGVTTEIRLVDELPRNPNGKVLRRELRGTGAAIPADHADTLRGAAARDCAGMRR